MSDNGDSKKVLDYYRAVSYELAGQRRLNTSMVFSLPCEGKRVKKRIAPVGMTNEVAANQGIWWYPELLKVFHIAEQKQLVKDIIVHGSYGDFSSTHFSDVEATIFVNDLILTDPRKMRGFSDWLSRYFNKLIVKVDPTQHHGAFFIWKDLAYNYSELILPCSAYDSCWSIKGESFDIFSVDDVEVIRRQSLVRLRETLWRLSCPYGSFFRFGVNDYSVKQYLSNLLLVPAFYYQSEGLILSKRDAILKFKREFSVYFLKSISEASDIRSNWPKQSWVLGLLRSLIVRGKIPQGRLDLILVAFLSSRRKSFKKNSLPRMIAESKSLLELFFEDNK